MFVSRYMSKPVVGIRPETLLPEIREMLQARRFRHLPVLGGDNRLLGMVTDRDLRSAFPTALMTEEERCRYLERFNSLTARDIMTEVVHTLNERATLDDALLLFDRSRVGALPVVDDSGRAVGILSVRDMLAAYRGLFGLGEKGSRLMAVADDGKPKIFSRLTAVLENEEIPFTRIVKGCDTEEGADEKCIYIRVHTYNSSHVRSALEKAGFTLAMP